MTLVRFKMTFIIVDKQYWYSKSQVKYSYATYLIFKWDPKIHWIRNEKHKTNINRELITSINITHGDDLAHLRYLDQRPFITKIFNYPKVCVCIVEFLLLCY